MWARGGLCCFQIPATLLVLGGAQDRWKAKGRGQPHLIHCELQLQAQAAFWANLLLCLNSKCILEGSGSGHIKYRNKMILLAGCGGGAEDFALSVGAAISLEVILISGTQEQGSGRHVGCFKTPVFYLELQSSQDVHQQNNSCYRHTTCQALT